MQTNYLSIVPVISKFEIPKGFGVIDKNVQNVATVHMLCTQPAERCNPMRAFGTPRNYTSCLVHLLSAIARRPPYWNYLCHMICGGQNGGRQHAGPFGSPRKFPFRALTHAVSARGTKYSSEVCRMHAGQAADTSDLPIQSRP